MRDLGTLGGNRSWAGAINNVGHIVGNSYSVDDKHSSMHAFLWDSSTGMRDLGTLGGNTSGAGAINDHGQVVGYSYTIDNDYDSIRAFIWDSNNGMVPLDELLHADCEWIELRPQGINNRGQIVGHGINETLQRRSAFLMTPIPPKVIYVDDDATGANDGSSWADAFNHLQDALAAAWSGDEICVAEGIYTPDSNSANPNGSGDRTATFQLINGVTIKGGYAGTGTPDPNTRNIDFYETILSGDLDRNDVDVNDPADLLNEPTRAENSYHVVTGSGTDETAVLDGFTITGGNADEYGYPFYHKHGGGMYNTSSKLTITNCTFINNAAGDYGGGIYSRSGKPALANCTFKGNSAEFFGGGLYCQGLSSPILTDCNFSQNSTGWSGGGMSVCNSSPIMTNCVFIRNSARWGGAMDNISSMPKLLNCTFSGNSAENSGGGMYNNCSKPNITKCIFNGNMAGNGGGMHNWGSSVTLTNCILSGNSAIFYGGAIHSEGGGPTPSWPVTGGSLAIINCAFAGNLAANGNAVVCDSSAQEYPSDVDFTNCILFDGGDEIWNNDVSTITITYSNVRNNWSGEGNIDADPCFVQPGYWDVDGVWIDGDYHLMHDSPCIDAGDPNYIAEPNETDLDGSPRVIGGRIDMGAYETPIFAEARILPRTINLASKGKWITCYIWLPDDYDVTDIDPDSVRLEQQIKAEQLVVNEQEQVAIARFDREVVQSILKVGDIKLKITCQLTDGTVFEATDIITVIDKAGGKSVKQQ
jgi:probable HAF family extracellular repeat protein/predicted outer membrane repeat protein